MRKFVRDARRAFTLVEVLVVVTIIGLAGAIVVPHLLTAGTLGVQAAARAVIADILYAQNDAIAAQAPRRVVFDLANNRYWLTNDVSFDLDVLPAPTNAMSVAWKGGSSGANYLVDFETDNRFDGVTIQNAGFSGMPTLEFDALGGPTSGGSVDVVFNNTRLRITIAPFTGRVTVAQVAMAP